MNAFLEHANLTVRDLDEAVRFLTTACPEFVVRHRGENAGGKWLHLGTETSYFALGEPLTATEDEKKTIFGVNHLGIVVGDADALKARLLAAGYQESYIVSDHPQRKRLYFLDSDGFEWEFVQYFSDDVAKQNDYSE